MKKLSASDKSSLIRLASSLPAGSEERRAILAGLVEASSGSVAVAAFKSWINKNRSAINSLKDVYFEGDFMLEIVEEPDFCSLKAYLGYDEILYETHEAVLQASEDNGFILLDLGGNFNRGNIAKGALLAEDASREGTLTEKLVHKALDPFLKRLLKENEPKLKVKVGPEGEYMYYFGTKKIGEVWRGLDKKWHNSKSRNLVFTSKAEALKDLTAKGSSGLGSPAPIFE